MTNKLKLIGAALLALAILPAAVLLFHVSTPHILGMCAMIGGSTIVYGSFQTGQGIGGGYTGGSTAPTVAQASQVQAVTATIQFGDTDTIATVTHNFSLTAAQTAALGPYLQTYFSAFAATTNTYPLLTFAVGANAITINKVTNTGTGGTLVCIIRRPYSASA